VGGSPHANSPPPLAGEGRVGAPNGLLANDSAQLKHRQPSK
jgi:hypothetical protein